MIGAESKCLAVVGKGGSAPPLPPLSTKCLRQLVRCWLAVGGANLEIRRDGKDRFQRTLAQVVANGTDVAEPMISEGMARPCKSAGCRKSWCEAR
jgi:endonuclease YncB( thermonuclease family)